MNKRKDLGYESFEYSNCKINIHHLKTQTQTLLLKDFKIIIMTTGPHVMTTGPHVITTGPYVMTTGPLVMTTGPHVMATGPHVMATGPHVMTTGPLVMTTGPHISKSFLGKSRIKIYLHN